LQICAHEHCPERENELVERYAEAIKDVVDAEIIAAIIEQAKESE
jgi:hypothetical protein